MKQENKNGALKSLDAGQRTDRESKNNHNQGVNMIAQKEIKPMTKKEVFLTTLINQGKRGLNTFEANKMYGDSCLHSEISSLGNEHNIVACREWETLTNPHKTRCMRYWLADDDLPKAKKLVDFMRIDRGEKPLFEV